MRVLSLYCNRSVQRHKDQSRNMLYNQDVLCQVLILLKETSASLFGSLISIRLDQVYSDFGSRAFRCLLTVHRGTEDAQLRNLRSAALRCRRALHWLRRIVGGLLPGLYPVRISHLTDHRILFAAIFGSLPASSEAPPSLRGYTLLASSSLRGITLLAS